MLHRVAEYVDKNGVAYRPGYKCKSARFAIHCDEDGRFLGIDRLVTAGAPKGRAFNLAPEFTFAEIKGGKERKSHFLIDSADTVALLDPEAEDRVVQKHEYFWRMIKAAGEEVPQLAPLARLIEIRDKISSELRSAGAKPSDVVTFRIGSKFPLDEKETYWHEWWDTWRAQTIEAQSGEKRNDEPDSRMVSYLSGRRVEPIDTHPKLNNVPGGVTAGVSLIGFDKPSFRSFRLLQSQNAAMSELESVKYVAGLNDLIQKHSRNIAGMRVIYWYKDTVAAEDDPIGLADLTPADETIVPMRRMRELLDAVRTGQRPDLEGNEYYILSLSGAGGRAMVRSWEEGTYERLASNIVAWLDDLTISTIFGSVTASAPRIQQVIQCVLPPKKNSQQYEDWLKPVTNLRSALWTAAIDKLPIPFAAAARVLDQLRSFALTGGYEAVFEGKPHQGDPNPQWLLWTRMALLKAYHVRNSNISGENALMPQLNPDHPSPAYQCGRLMAVLAEVQRAALGDVGANVIQRYYAAASTTPALVLGRMVRNAQFHLGKMEGDKPGLAVWFQQRLAEIHCKIGDNAPSTLTLEEQTLFALGFYQQTADRFNGKNKDTKQQEETAQ
jgi:CRISPR-associated protein Csd1